MKNKWKEENIKEIVEFLELNPSEESYIRVKIDTLLSDQKKEIREKIEEEATFDWDEFPLFAESKSERKNNKVWGDGFKKGYLEAMATILKEL